MYLFFQACDTYKENLHRHGGAGTILISLYKKSGLNGEWG